MRVAPLDRAQLAEAELVLADACAFDRASDVADEKLFGPAPRIAKATGATTGAQVGEVPAHAFGAWDDTGALVGVAAVSGRYVRALAVVPRARKRGAGSALLAECERVAREAGEPRLRMLDQPGNYLAPGVDVRNTDAIAWAGRRGFRRDGDQRCNVLVAVRDNPRVTAARADELAAKARAKGYDVRRAAHDERGLLDAVAVEFGNAWPFELAAALAHEPAGVHVAQKGGAYCAFAAHDGNNRGLGWFGPTGTWPEHRGQGLGEALLLACLVDVAAEHARCEVAWIGPRPFYDKVAGIVEDRYFAALIRDL